MIKRFVVLAAAVMMTASFFTLPAQGFSSSSSTKKGGVTYKVSATSCWVYVRSCSWSSKMSMSKSRAYTHRTDVKANGLKANISISKAGPSVSISGNHTKLAKVSKTGRGRSYSMSGVATPSILSVSVAAKGRLSSGGVSLQTGWTTW